MTATHPLRIIVTVVVSLGATPQVGRGQTDSLAALFIAQARAGASHLRDPRAALAAGYRPVGPEVPAMGRHWILPSLLVSGRIDPAAPPVLEYATIGGADVLVGVAYAVLLGPGESGPDVPVAHQLWHTHAGDLDDEALADSHAGSGDSLGDRVAVLHIWVPVENPAGPFVAENWSLPFLRVGLRAPPDAPVASAKAVALGSGWESYFEAQLRLKRRLDHRNELATTALYSAFADSVSRWLRGRAGSDSLGTRDIRWLTDLWGRLQAGLAALVPPKAMGMDPAGTP
jgi:hypothetical protein